MKRTVLALVIGATFTLAGCNEPTATESVAKGENMLAKDDFRAAGIEFKAALQQDPKHVDARIGLAKIALENRDFSGAITELERARDFKQEQGGSVDEINALISRAAHRSEEDYTLMELSGEGEPEIAYYQLIRLTTDNKLEESQTLFNTISKKDSPFTDLSRVLVTAIEFSAEKAMELMPTSTEGFDEVQLAEYSLLSSGIAIRNGDIGKAIESLKAYYDLNPGDYERALQLSHMMVEEKRYEEAEPIVKTLVELFPQHGMITELNAIIAYEKEDFETAISSASASIVADPNKVMPRLIASYSAESTGDSETALENLEFVIDRLPEDHPAQRLYIKLKAETGDLDEVAEKALSLSDLSSIDTPLLTTLGLEMLRSGDVDSAKKFAKKAESLGAEGEGRSALGLLQLSVGDEDAFSNLEEAFSNNPESKVVGDNLATAYLAAERYEDAFALGEKWISNGKVVEGNMLKGVSAARMGEYSNARDIFNAVLEQVPQHFMARAGMLETQVQLGDFNKAAALFEEWVVQEGMAGLFRNYLAATRSERNPEEVESVINHFDKLIDSGKVTTQRASLMSGQAHYLVGNIEQSKYRLDQVKDGYLKTPDFYLLKATVSERLEQHNDAIDAYRAWHEMSPTLPVPVIGHVRVLAKLGQFDDAITVLDAAMPEFENQLPGRIMRMQLLIAKRDWGQLNTDFIRLPDEIQETPFGKAVKGVLSVRKGNFKAAKDIAPLLDDYPNEDFLRWTVAGYSEVPELRGQILPLLEKYTSNNPGSAVAWFMLGNEYAGNGDFDKAITPYKKVAKITPNNALVLNNLAYTELKIGRANDAVKHAAQAVKASPDQGSFVETLGSALIETGKPDEAVNVMESFVNKGFEVNDVFKATLEKARSM